MASVMSKREDGMFDQKTNRQTESGNLRRGDAIVTVIKAAAVQISPVLYSREGTVEKVCREDH